MSALDKMQIDAVVYGLLTVYLPSVTCFLF